MTAAATEQARAPRPGSVSRAIFLVVGAVFTALAIGYGVTIIISLLSYQSTTERTAYSQDIRRVVLDVAGDVHIVGIDAGRTTVERRLRWSLGRPWVAESVEGDTLTIRSRCGLVLAAGCSSDFFINLPRAAAIDADSSADDVVVTGLTGDVALTSSGGDVEVRSLSGRVVLKSSAGNVVGADLRSAEVHARSSAGDVELRFATPPSMVDADSTAGDVRVRLPAGLETYQVQAESSAGDVFTDVRTDPSSTRVLNLQSSAGDVVTTYQE
jgi:DUF4097 and DUF4098 domain-containing protein YvlB